MKQKQKWLKYFSLLLISLSVSSCAPVAFIAGATTGGLLIANKKKLSMIKQDHKIIHYIEYQWQQDPSLHHKSRLIVTSLNRTVLLLGQTPTARQRLRAYQLAKNTPNIKHLYNQITVQGPISALTRSSDAWITTKAKSVLLSSTHLKAVSIKVVTENGIVYLLGEVSRQQAKLAAQSVRKITGVQKVVKLFDCENKDHLSFSKEG